MSKPVAPSPTETEPSAAQITQFQARLARVNARITQATIKAQRTDKPTLLAVSKAKPATAIAAAICAGLYDFGENYLQEALEKQRAIAAWHSANSPPITWHYIGNVQSNKTRPLAEHFDWVHTISSEKQLRRLNEQRPERLPPLNICLQVNIDDEPQKQGITAEAAMEIAHAAQHYPRLQLRGLMCIPAQGKQAASFHALAQLLQDLRQAFAEDHENHQNVAALNTLSMGMSNDLESAIAAGSTLVRIGSALFGDRS